MAMKFLDGPGLQYAFAKIKAFMATKANTDLSNVDAEALSALAGMKTYTSLSDLDLTGVKTMAEVCGAMEYPSRLVLNNSTSAENHISDVPGTYGTIEIVRVAANYCFAIWAKSSGTDPDFYEGTYHGDNGWSGWFLRYSENNKPKLEDIGALPAADYYKTTANTIAEGSDLDTYTTPGTYRCANGTISKTLVNTPHKTSGFKMTVKQLADSNQLMQTIEAVNGSYNYVRTASKSNDIWTFKEWAGASSNIKFYTKFDQIGLDDASFAGMDLLTIMREINTAVGTDAVEFFIHTTPTINPNFRQAILDKLATDVSPFESTWTANITAYMRRSVSLYQSFLIDVVYQNDEYQNSVISSVYNANSDGTDSMSTFVYSKLQGGFLPLAGGTLTGKSLYLGNGLARVLAETNRLQLETYNEAGNTNNRRVFHLRNSTHGSPDAKDALVWFDTVEGEQTMYRLYGEHNKPTADDVGAAKATHNHSATEINSGILPVARGGTGQTSLSALATAMGASQIKVGSYTGTGKVGSANPNSITVGFTPKLLFVSSDGMEISGEGTTPLVWCAGITQYTHGGDAIYFTATPTGISWYLNKTNATSSYIAAQLNTSGKTYYYVALG